MSRAEDELRRLLAINQYEHRGKRAVNKPLLVLLAVSAWRQTGSSRLDYQEVESRLGGLIKEFGPPSKTVVNQAAAYPFFYLQNDGVWDLDREVSKPYPSQLRGTSGQLNASIESALAEDSDALVAVVTELIEREFPPTLREDVLEAVGLGDLALDRAPVQTAEKRRRSAAWRYEVLNAWDSACAFCGYDGRLAGLAVGVEAAHIRWFTHDGPDSLDNGLALCSLHHKLFDRGALGLTPERRVQVANDFAATGHMGRAVYELHGLILKPRPGTSLPARDHIEWHSEQVFRSPALSA